MMRVGWMMTLSLCGVLCGGCGLVSGVFSKPDPDSPEAVAKREKAAEEVLAEDEDEGGGFLGLRKKRVTEDGEELGELKSTLRTQLEDLRKERTSQKRKIAEFEREARESERRAKEMEETLADTERRIKRLSTVIYYTEHGGLDKLEKRLADSPSVYEEREALSSMVGPSPRTARDPMQAMRPAQNDPEPPEPSWNLGAGALPAGEEEGLSAMAIGTREAGEASGGTWNQNPRTTTAPNRDFVEPQTSEKPDAYILAADGRAENMAVIIDKGAKENVRRGQLFQTLDANGQVTIFVVREAFDTTATAIPHPRHVGQVVVEKGTPLKRIDTLP